MSFYPCSQEDCHGTMKLHGRAKYKMFKCDRCGFMTSEEKLQAKVRE